MGTIIDVIVSFFVEELFFGFIKILKNTGAAFLRLLGGWKKPISYYTKLDNYGYLPHFIGLIIISILMFAFLKIFN